MRIEPSPVRPRVQALVLADRHHGGLETLLHRSAPDLVPVAGKSLIGLILEELKGAGVNKAHIAVSEGAAQMEKRLGDGTRFGMELHFVLTRGDRPLSQLLFQLNHEVLGVDLLVVDTALRHGAVEPFLRRVALEGLPAAEAFTVDNLPLGLRYLRADPIGEHRAPAYFPAVMVSGAKSRAVASMQDLMRLNFEVVRGEWPDLNVAARLESPGVLAGRLARFHAASVVETPVFIGAASFVHRRCRLGPEVVVGDHCYIDKGADLSHVMVMRGTYVGENVRLSGVILDGDRIVDPVTGEVTHIDRSEVVSRLDHEPPSAWAGALLGRLLAALCLVACAALAPLWLLFCLAADRSRPLRFTLRATSAKTGRPFYTYEGASSIPFWHFLPWLLAVAAGHLRWIGTRPIGLQDSLRLSHDWEKVREDAPAGLFGPAQQAYIKGADEMECRLADSLFACRRSFALQAAWTARLVLGLLSPRMWLPSGRESVHWARRRPSKLSRHMAAP